MKSETVRSIIWAVFFLLSDHLCVKVKRNFYILFLECVWKIIPAICTPPLCGIFYPNSVAVARYGALIRAKYTTNCDAHLAESLFQTRSRVEILHKYNMDIQWNWYSKFIILNVMGCQSQKVWQTKGFIYEKTTEKKQRNYSTYIYDEQRTVLAEV